MHLLAGEHETHWVREATVGFNIRCYQITGSTLDQLYNKYLSDIMMLDTK